MRIGLSTFRRAHRPVDCFATITPMTAGALLRRLSACSLLVCTLSATRVLAQGQSPSKIAGLLDSLQKVKPIGPVALSPDGSTVAMVLDNTLTLQSLHPASLATTPSVCPKSTPGSISSLTWSPGGQQLAILAVCGESTGVYLLDAPQKSQARRLLEVHGFAESLRFAPDGKHLGMLYVEGASRPSGALAAMKPPSGVIGVQGLEIQRVAVIDAGTGKLDQVTPATLHVYEFDWSPDSATLAYVAAPPPGENNWWVAKLYTQAANASQPKLLLDPVTVEGPLHGLQVAIPRWSPDGSTIAFIGGLMSDQGATGGDIFIMPATGGTPKELTPGIPSSPTWLRWQSASSIQFTEVVSGASSLAHLSLNQAAEPNGGNIAVDFVLPETIGSGSLEMELSFAANGTAAMTRSSFGRAPEVWLWSPHTSEAGRSFTQISNLNTGNKPEWGVAQPFGWTNQGFQADGWLLYPANYNPEKKYPMIVMVHGGPSSAALPRWPGAGFGAAPFSAMGYFVFEPNPRGSYGEGEAFTQANRKDFGYGDLRDILAGVDAVEHQIPAIDDRRIGLTGWSYGGFMTMFSVSQTQRFKAAVAGAGVANWQSYYGENSIDQWMTPFFGATVYDDPAIYAKSSAITFIKQIQTPTLVVVGDRDGECPAPQSFEFWHALKAQGVDTQLVIYPNEGHGFVDPAHRRDVIERAVAWFDAHMQ